MHVSLRLLISGALIVSAICMAVIWWGIDSRAFWKEVPEIIILSVVCTFVAVCLGAVVTYLKKR